jgi:hypothetical protein
LLRFRRNDYAGYLSKCWASSTLTSDIISTEYFNTKLKANCPQNNSIVPDLSGLFVKYAQEGGDYHVSPTSQYKHAGNDGKDPGADVDAIMDVVNVIR